MEKTEHTPTPWPAPEYDNDTGPNDDGFWEWWDIPGVARFDRQEDAEFARQACNTHDRLVEALKRITDGAVPAEVDDEDAGMSARAEIDHRDLAFALAALALAQPQAQAQQDHAAAVRALEGGKS